MTKEIVYTDKYALILSDEIPTKVYYDTYIHQLKHTGGAEYGESSIAKKVIGHLPLTDDAPILEGVPLLPPLPQGDDVDALASTEILYNTQKREWWEQGYNKAKEKYKYTEFNIIQAFEYGWNQRHFGKMDENELQKIQQNFIQSLQQPSRPTHFECKMEITHEGNGTYSVELLGKYLNK
jgi:hypothetical protein